MTAALELALDAALCALILGVALAVVAGRGVFRAVVFFIVYGLLAAVAWVRLDAVNVALAEAAIGAGLTGVLLLAAHGRLRARRRRMTWRMARPGPRCWPGARWPRRWAGRGSRCRCPCNPAPNWPRPCRAPASAIR
jgi:uncharacterized MnhB-related membrane protein